MFEDDRPKIRRTSRIAIIGLAVLSLTALIVTAWILADFNHELEVLSELTEHLPPGDRADANLLAGELRLQWRLSVLLIVNIVASGVALLLLTRAYLGSQRSLRKVRVLATDILASLDQGVITTDGNATILSINPRGRELLNLSTNGIGIALDSLPNEFTTLDELCREVRLRQESVSEREVVIHENGDCRHILAGCSLLRDHDQRQIGTVIHLRDVTEKTLVEQRLRRMERYLGLGSLAAGLQHEIKNPLSALSLHVQLLKESLNNNYSETVNESLHVISNEVRRITKVLEGFQDFASIAKLNRESVDIRSIIEKLVTLTDPQAQQMGIRLTTEFQEIGVVPISVDPVRIEQVLLNLLVNAFAAIVNDGTVTIRLRQDEQATLIDVCDTGPGIPDDLRDKIFDPYFTTRSTGTGMGLALSEKIIRQHDGTIEFQTSSRGTIFTVSLPRESVST